MLLFLLAFGLLPSLSALWVCLSLMLQAWTLQSKILLTCCVPCHAMTMQRLMDSQRLLAALLDCT